MSWQIYYIFDSDHWHMFFTYLSQIRTIARFIFQKRTVTCEKYKLRVEN